MKYLTQNWQTTMSGANMVALGISGFLAAYLGGIIIKPYGFNFYFLVTGLVTVSGIVFFQLIFRKMLNKISMLN